ncbi:tape measure protein [Agrococcus casei]|uniref:tape measure protein n=1 Tax=Agrococcus casei TaxID=343512 RepID=UPI003F8DE851
MAKGVELATAWVRLVPSFEGVQGQIAKELGGVDTRKVGRGLGGQFASNIGAGIKAAATGTVAVAAGLLGTALVKGLGRLNALDQATQKLTGLGHSADSVDAIMKNALASVKGTAFGMDAAATVAASSVAAGIKPGQELERTLSLVADAATIAGTDMGSMGAIFNKVAASNKVQMDVINQLHDAGVPALASLAEYMGVTAEEASKMASRGEIDFETFQAAMETSLGGAAASSGDTFSGAMANVLAAIGRVGSGILGGIFPKLAPLFQGLTTTLGPLEDRAAEIGAVIGDKLAPVLDWLTEALKGGLGEFKVAPQIIAPLTGAFVALGSSGLGPLLRMVPGLGGFASKLGILGGPVGLAIAAFVGLVAVTPELQAALGDLFAAVLDAGTAAAPALSEIAGVVGGVLVQALQIATPIIVGAITALSGFITWVAETPGVLQGLAIAVGAATTAWVGYKAVTGAMNFVGMITGLYKKAAAFTASTVAKGKDLVVTTQLRAMYARDFVVAIGRQIAAVAASTGAWVKNTAVMVAQRAALVAAAVASRAVTAAQWLMNAAMSANPIGLIITAIVALVAGLIWFFTQTELGQEIWQGFVDWLVAAWEWVKETAIAIWEAVSAFFVALWQGIVDVATSAWQGFTDWIQSVTNGIATWWNDLWSGVGSFFTNLWDSIVQLVVSYLTWYVATVRSIVSAVVAWWNNIWSSVGSFFSNLWRSIVDAASNAIRGVQSTIQSVVGSIVSWWRSTWSSVGSFFSNLWDGIVSAVRNAGRAFGNVFQGIRDAVSNAFSGIVNIVRGPVNGIISLVNSAISGLNGLSVSIPDWVPGVGGGTFGLNIPSIPMLADGATVLPRRGGTLAILAEAGRPESVVDTGLVNRALEEGLSGNGSAGTTVNGPLVNVEQLVVDSDRRVDELSKALYERAERAARAGGKINLGGATV